MLNYLKQSKCVCFSYFCKCKLIKSKHFFGLGLKSNGPSLTDAVTIAGVNFWVFSATDGRIEIPYR